MADTTTDLWGNILNAGVSVGSNILTNSTLNNQMTTLSNAYGQAGNYVQGAQNTAAGYAAPYMTMGVNEIPDYLKAANAVGSSLTMDQFQNSPYYQAGLAAQQTQTNALKAGSAATGMYGSGNMANALNQNALTTMMGSYDTANKQNLTQQQAAAAARYNPVALGQGSSTALGNQTIETGKSMGTLATGLAGKTNDITALQNTANQTLLGALAKNPSIVSGLSSGAKAIYDKLTSGGSPTPTETIQLTTELDSLGGTTDFSDYYKGITGFESLGGSVPGMTGTDLSSMYGGSSMPTNMMGGNFFTTDSTLANPINYATSSGGLSLGNGDSPLNIDPIFDTEA